MAVQLTPPKKNVFYLSVLLALAAILLYLLGMFGVVEGGFQAIGHYVFWLAVLGWVALAAGVAMKGV